MSCYLKGYVSFPKGAIYLQLASRRLHKVKLDTFIWQPVSWLIKNDGMNVDAEIRERERMREKVFLEFAKFQNLPYSDFHTTLDIITAKLALLVTKKWKK